MKNFFNNHSLRYQFAFINSLLIIFNRDSKQFIYNLFREPEFLFPLLNDKQLGVRISNYLDNALSLVEKEIDFYANIDKYRQKALYSDYSDGLNSLNIEKFSEIKNRVTKLNKFITLYISDLKGDGLKIEMIETFKKEKYYIEIEKSIKKLLDKNYNSFENLKEIIIDFREVVSTDEFIKMGNDLPAKIMNKPIAKKILKKLNKKITPPLNKQQGLT